MASMTGMLKLSQSSRAFRKMRASRELSPRRRKLASIASSLHTVDPSAYGIAPWLAHFHRIESSDPVKRSPAQASEPYQFRHSPLQYLYGFYAFLLSLPV